jgi:hypothetical protein
MSTNSNRRQRNSWTVSSVDLSSNKFGPIYREKRQAVAGWSVEYDIHGRTTDFDNGSSFSGFEWTSHSDMHDAIKSNDFGRMQCLLKNGEKLCFGDGKNCFAEAAQLCLNQDEKVAHAAWDLLKKMLRIEPRGVNSRDKGTKRLCIEGFNNLKK